MDKKRLIIYPVLFAMMLAIATLGFQDFSPTGSILLTLIVTLSYFTFIFIIAQIIKDNSIVDIGWGFGFVLGSVVTLLTTEDPTILSYLITGFIAVWGLRLSVRLFKRNWGNGEDFRYAQWRKEWGDKVVITAFFRVFMIQGLINFVVGSASYATIKFNTFAFSGWLQTFVYAGLAIAIIGLFFEVVGDEQLRRHIQKGQRTLMTKGLWSVTRHPNYFGEILIWVGLYITGFVLIDSDFSMVLYGILFISPLIMTLVLVKISTPLLEKRMEKYDGWQTYTQTTPMIFPWSKS